MAYRRKGGSALMALAKAGGKRRRAAKKAKEAAKVVAANKANRLIAGDEPKRKITPKPVARKKVAQKTPKPASDKTARVRAEANTPKATRIPPSKKALPAAKKVPRRSSTGRSIPKDITPSRSAVPKRKPHGRVIPRDITPGRSPATKAQRKPKTSAYDRLLKADRDKKFAPGAGGSLRGGTISKTDPRQSAAHGPGAMSGAIKRAKKSTLGRLLDLPIDEGLIGAGAGGKSAINLGNRLNKARKLRNAGRRGGEATARKRRVAAGEKTAEGYKQFDIDRKLRSRNRRRRN